MFPPSGVVSQAGQLRGFSMSVTVRSPRAWPRVLCATAISGFLCLAAATPGFAAASDRSVQRSDTGARGASAQASAIRAALSRAHRSGRTQLISALSTASSRTVANPDGSLTTTSTPSELPAAVGPANANLTRPGYDETQSSRRCATKPGWNRSFPHGLGVGYTRSGHCPGIDRTYFQFSLRSILPAESAETVHIQSAALHTLATSRSDRACARAWPVRFYSVSAIGPHTDWRNQPRLKGDRLLATVRLRARKGPRSACQPTAVEVKVPASVAQAAAARDSTWTVALAGDEHMSAANLGFTEFSKRPSLVITYDVTPPAPSSTGGAMTTTPEPVVGATPDNGCAPEAPGWINQDTITLNAALSPAISGEPVQGKFELRGPDGEIISSPASAYVVPGSDGSAAVSAPAGVTLQDGETYSWQVAASVAGNPPGSDGPYLSGWSGTCSFGVDLTPPLQPTVSSAEFPPTGSSMTSGTFSFTSSDPAPSCSGCQASGVYEFRYALDGPAGTGASVLATTNDGTATASTPTIALPSWGSHVLNVEAIDNAGNVSAVQSYSFSASTTTQNPLIYSPQVEPGGTYSGTQPLSFTFSSENATPSSCTPVPCDNDIVGFAYQWNNNQFPVSPSVTPATVSGGVANLSVSFPALPHWGLNTLYVMAVDANGDPSLVYNYAVNVPSDALTGQPVPY
jgi:hypothetical protein